ncbi:exonuclease domain-containing protein [Aeriscardovia aeriphila]|uniref:DNA polymerase III subunit epsilon n=1 Tax=Aeriscardovia aeriphila TaxID=218139 RepID=A0A261FBH7_9BIFI|nr:exonuclease domain-containing protein [Aeriscardovia aeriphila]NYI25336.1 DNA polymerase III epsilon subunit-like protein [Aeriscardovia aeriphila]OZG56510.1 DNA polymerase III subunit epsilon [Aeriscardovia aeriphila]
MVTLLPEEFDTTGSPTQYLMAATYLNHSVNNSIVFIDTETTGLTSEDKLLSLAITDQQGGTLFYEKFNPGEQLLTTGWPQAEKINHISPTDVKNCRPFNDYFTQIDSILQGKTAVSGYNTDGFDLSKIRQEGYYGFDKLASLDLMPLIIAMYSPYWNDPTKKIYEKAPHLTDVARYFNITYDPHDALNDTRATAQCFARTMEAVQKRAQEKLAQEQNLSKDNRKTVITVENKDFRGVPSIYDALYPAIIPGEKALDGVDEVHFINCNFEGLERIQLDGLVGQAIASFDKCNFNKTSFWDLGSKTIPTNFTHCTFKNSHLQGIGEDYNFQTSLHDCDLSNATLETLYFEEGSFANINLTGAHINECTWYVPDDFTNVDFTDVTLHNVAFDYVKQEIAQQLIPVMRNITLDGVSVINQVGYYQANNRLYTAPTLNHYELTMNGDYAPTMDGDVEYSRWRTIEQDMYSPEKAELLFAQDLPGHEPEQHRGLNR